MNNKTIGICAYNIHQGGGKNVLIAFLNSTDNLKKYTCFIDSRLNIQFSKYQHINFIKIRPTLISRISFEFKAAKISRLFSEFYFLGNLPPLRKLNSVVILFLQNRLLLLPVPITFNNFKLRIKLNIEKAWFHLFKKNVTSFQVQTESMKNALALQSQNKKIEIRNYINTDELLFYFDKFKKENQSKKKNTFICITSLEPHKNLKNLFDALRLLPLSKLSKIELIITIKEESYIKRKFNVDNLKVTFLQTADRETLLRYLFTSEYLLFPSFCESLGLPLIESKVFVTKTFT